MAMSSEQRQQIESCIEGLTREHMLFQQRLEEDSKKDEGLIKKNLENVKGYERDIIYVSMTYGPREIKGKVYQRFGPVNSDTGWCRLNVLFIRSRKRMHIFSEAEISAIERLLRALTSPVIGKQAPTEDEEINNIIEIVEKQAKIIDKFILQKITLKEKLLGFEREVLRKAMPHTPEKNRLLRPAMLNKILDHKPSNKVEFFEYIPSCLIGPTLPQETKFLDNIFNIINTHKGIFLYENI